MNDKDTIFEHLMQLKINIDLLHKTHATRGIDTTSPYTKNTEDALKLAFANNALSLVNKE